MFRTLARALLTIGSLGLLLTLAAAQQGTLKFGYVDAQQVVLRSKAGQAAMRELEKAKAEKEKELRKRQQEITEMERELINQQFTLSAEEKERRSEEIRRRRVDLDRLYQDAKDELDRKESKALSKLEKEVLHLINKIGKERGYSFILGRVAASVLYADPSLDLTAEIVKMYDESFAAAGGKK